MKQKSPDEAVNFKFRRIIWKLCGQTQSVHKELREKYAVKRFHHDK